MMRLPMLLAAAALATLSLGAAPAAKPTATPKAATKPATKPAAKPGATKAAPKKAPQVKVLPAASPTPDVPAMMDGERVLATGEAKWKLGKDDLEADEVQGTIQTSGPFKIAKVVFPAGKREKLQIEFMYEGIGEVNEGYLTNLFAVDGGGRYHAWKKGVSACVVTLEKATAFEVAGTAHCPKGLLDTENPPRPAKPITEVKFHAKADPAVAAKKVE